MTTKTGEALFKDSHFYYLEGNKGERQDVEDNIMQQESSVNRSNKSNLSSQQCIKQNEEDKKQTDDKLSSNPSQSLSQSSMSNSDSIGLDDQEKNSKKFLQFLKNCLILIAFQFFGPFLSTYFIIKYDFLKSLPLRIKLRTIIQITFKATIISLSLWIMALGTLFDDDALVTKDHNYYKIEFIFNCVTGLLITLSGGILGKSVLFNNQFFSQLYYLSEEKMKKMKNKEELKLLSQPSSQKSFNDKSTMQDLQGYENTEIFECIIKERKIQQRLVSVMKRLFIDSQTFALYFLSQSKSDEEKSENSGKEGQPKQVPFLKPQQSSENKVRQPHQIISLPQSNRHDILSAFPTALPLLKEKKLKPVQPTELQTSVKNVSQQIKVLKKLQTFKVQNFQLDFKSETKRKKSDDLDYSQEAEEEEEEELVLINGRKLCNELLVQCEKVESLKKKYIKRGVYCLFILLKGVLPGIFRTQEGLSFYGSSIIVGITCQLNRQLVYGVFIGFLMFSIDLDVMNSFTSMVNNLLDYRKYLISPTKINKEAQSDKTKNPIQKNILEKIFYIGTGDEDVQDEKNQNQYLMDNEDTPAIDFTDISSVMAWNNMRKLGFHYKQKDINMIDRVSFVFWAEAICIIFLFLLDYSGMISLGEEYKAAWVIIMLVMDVFIVIYSQLIRVHTQVLINKSFVSSIRSIMKVKHLLQQSKIIDHQKHIVVGQNKRSANKTQQKDSIYEFYSKIKKKLDQHEKQDIHHYDKLVKLIQFVQDDIKYDMENDQLKFLGLITATSAFEATLLTSVLGCVYWLFRAYMKYLNIDLGLLND